MSDLYTVLRQSILDRDLRSVSAREEVYAQARTAMIRQLWSYDPPLAEDEIDQRVGQFDTAVDRIESDIVATFDAADERASAMDVTGADVAEDEYVPAEIIEDDAEVRERLPAPAPVKGPRREVVLRAAAERESAIEAALRFGNGPPEIEGVIVEVPETHLLPPPDHDYDDEPRHGSSFDDEAFAAAVLSAAGASQSGGAVTVSRVPRIRKKPLANRTRVRLLIGAIGVLALALVALAVFVGMTLFGQTASNPDDTATGPTEVVVSDAATAERIPKQPADVVQSFSIFDGSDPTVFDASPDNPVKFDNDKDGYFARVTSSASSPGARIIVGPGVANLLASNNIRVTIVARATPGNGADGFRFSFQSGVALSQWQKADAHPGYTAYGLEWRVPALRTDAAGDYILVEPGIPGDGTGVDLKSVQIELLKS